MESNFARAKFSSIPDFSYHGLSLQTELIDTHPSRLQVTITVPMATVVPGEFVHTQIT